MLSRIGNVFRIFAVLFLLGNCSVFAQTSDMPRVMAPDVMKTIPVSLVADETINTHDVIELTTGNEYPWAEQVRFDRQVVVDGELVNAVSCLEFQFKPVRMIDVDLPNARKQFEKKRVLYMVYSVTNKRWTPEGEKALARLNEPVEYEKLPTEDLSITLGSSICSEKVDERTFLVKPLDVPVQFFPSFVLASTQNQIDPQAKIGYTDRFIPLAFAAIVQREQYDVVLKKEGTIPLASPNGPEIQFESTVSMAERVLQPGETAWGIAMWTDVDPRLNFFSVFVSGVSSAYRWENPEGGYTKGDSTGTGRQMVRKTLKLNFWRPGDAFNFSEKDIRYGVPIPSSVKIPTEDQKGVQAPVDYEWVYR